MFTIFTIGHSNHSIDQFLNLLTRHGVTAIADVRSMPFSRYTPHFNQANLKISLRSTAIAYVFLGDQLGARPQNPACYVDGKARYDLIAAQPTFQSGLERIVQGATRYRIALLCAEQDPLTCHRAILVCRYLQRETVQIQHIGKQGNLETHTQLEERLLTSLKFCENQQLSLLYASAPFTLSPSKMQTIPCESRAAAIAAAYEYQGDRIAYLEATQPMEEWHETCD